MKTLLSTKIISDRQKKLICDKQIKLIDKDFISISRTVFDIANKYINWIFTSKNAVNIVLQSEYKRLINFDEINFFCVGKNTRDLILKSGAKKTKMAKNSIKLANLIKKTTNKCHFTYFRGSIKNKEFSDFFKKNKIPLNEVQVYKTQLKPKKIKNEIDGIMFFSPSGIKSFKLKNEIGNVPCFSIGDTTSEYLTKFTSNIHTAKNPSIENVIKLAVQHLTNE